MSCHLILGRPDQRSLSLTHSDSQYQEGSTNVGGVGEDFVGGKERQGDEDGEEESIDVPHRETDTSTMVSTGVRGHFIGGVVMEMIIDFILETVCSPLGMHVHNMHVC